LAGVGNLVWERPFRPLCPRPLPPSTQKAREVRTRMKSLLSPLRKRRQLPPSHKLRRANKKESKERLTES
jgi:hypothetical protein